MARLPLLVEQMKRLAVERPRSAPVAEREALWWWMTTLEEMERGHE